MTLYISTGCSPWIQWPSVFLSDMYSITYVLCTPFTAQKFDLPFQSFIIIPSFRKLVLFVAHVTRSCGDLIFYWYTYHLKLDYPNVIVHIGNLSYWFQVVFSNYWELEEKKKRIEDSGWVQYDCLIKKFQQFLRYLGGKWLCPDS